MDNIIHFSFPNREEISKKFDENFEKHKTENKFNMDRVTNECLINLGAIPDDRSEFDRRRDKREKELFLDDLNKLIDFILSHPTD